jgi:UDP-3-O-[3-hydroxymyristoyl] glucosamine N-acyltransferase
MHYTMPILKEIIARIPCTEFIGSETVNVKDVQPLKPELSNEHSLFWCSDQHIQALKDFTAGTFICPDTTPRDFLVKNCNYLFVTNPRRCFQIIIGEFFADKKVPAGIAQTARIDPSVKISERVSIGEFTIIEAGCSIGEDTIIGGFNIIHRNTVIGSQCTIGAHNTIGADGFGYERNDKGELELIPHVGNVIIEDRVMIGDANTIDRSVLGSTRIRTLTNIDNHVYVAHNTDIGEKSVLMAHTAIMGSVTLGKNVHVAPAATILNTLTIPEDVFVGMGAVVIKAPGKGDVVVGNPARKIR